MTIARKWVLTAVVAGALVGGALGGAAFSAANGNAASKATTTVTTPSNPGTAQSGTFKPNENAAHEAGESAQREAQEDAGQFPTVP
jgi:hypothetical protein